MVIAISGLMVGFVLQSQQNTATADCYAATKLQLQDINGAIQRFARQKERLPLPASRSVGVEGVTYGREASGAAIDQIAGTSWGALPFQALGLNASYASDCWGNKFTYVVTTALTTNAVSGGFLDDTVLGNITVKKDAASNSSTTAAYAVISHGGDALGAVKNNYTASSHGWCTAAVSLASQNCLATSATIANAAFNNGKDAGASYFDDLVISSGRPQLLNSSNVYCWGTDKNGHGYLGDSSLLADASHYKTTPTKIVGGVKLASFAPLKSVWAEGPHCGLTAAGELYCWGYNRNADNKLMRGNGPDSAIPVKANTSVLFSRILQDDQGTWFMLGKDGKGYCGGQSYGACPIGAPYDIGLISNTANITKMAWRQENHQACGLDDTGIAYCWGGSGPFVGRGPNPANGGTPTAVSGGHKFSQIVAGYFSACAITSAADVGGAGLLYCWGDNYHGELGVGDQLPRNVPTLVPGHRYSAIFGGFESAPENFYARTTATDVTPNKMYAWGGSTTNPANLLGTGGVSGTDFGPYSVPLSGTPITDATLASAPSTFTTSSPHGLANGDQVYVYQSPAISNVAYPTIIWSVSQLTTVQNATATTFQLKDSAGNIIPQYSNNWNWTVAPDHKVHPSVAITNITKTMATPPVAVVTTSSPHGLVDGDLIGITNVGGMTQVNNKAFTVANVTPTTFELSGVDATSFSAYTSGGIAGSFIYVAKKPAACVFNAYGNTYICQPSPVPMNTTAVFSSIIINNSVALATTDDGSFYGWGINWGAPLTTNAFGLNATVSSPVAIPLPGGAKIQKILGASNPVQVLTRNNEIITWGLQDSYYANGNGVTYAYMSGAIPTGVKLNGFKFVDADESVFGWGADMNTCGIKFDPATDCDRQTVNWGVGCSTSMPAMVDGASNVLTADEPSTGTVTVTCTKNVVSLSGPTCAP